MLTEEESLQLAGLLRKLEWPVSLEVFYALADRTIFAGVDVALVTGQEVFLTRRPANDPYFANLWHLTGGVVMPGQTALSTLQSRALREVGGLKLKRAPEFVMARDILMGPPGPDHSPRGQEVYRLYRYVLSEEERASLPNSEDARLFPLDAVPDAFMAHQRPSIEALRALHGA